MHRPLHIPPFLPWLLASTALHALLLTQWPDAARQPTGTGGAQVSPIQIQVNQAAPAATAGVTPVPATTRPAPPQPDRTAATTAPAAPRPGRVATPRPEPTRPAIASVADATAPAAPDDRPDAHADVDGDRTAPGPIPERATASAVAASAPGQSADDDTDAAWLELAALLHQAIDRHKRYPQSALRMGREGAARIDFRLGPDGRIDDLNIGHSSGVRALDLAAFRAVQAIAPFADAHRYLDRARRFQVDVVFRIN